MKPVPIDETQPRNPGKWDLPPYGKPTVNDVLAAAGYRYQDDDETNMKRLESFSRTKAAKSIPADVKRLLRKRGLWEIEW